MRVSICFFKLHEGHILNVCTCCYFSVNSILAHFKVIPTHIFEINKRLFNTALICILIKFNSNYLQLITESTAVFKNTHNKVLTLNEAKKSHKENLIQNFFCCINKINSSFIIIIQLVFQERTSSHNTPTNIMSSRNRTTIIHM